MKYFTDQDIPVIHPIWLTYFDNKNEFFFQNFRLNSYFIIFQFLKLQQLAQLVFDVAQKEQIYSNTVFLSFRITQIVAIIVISFYSKKKFITNEICLVFTVITNLIFIIITNYKFDVIDDNPGRSYYNGTVTGFELFLPVICFEKWYYKSILVVGGFFVILQTIHSLVITQYFVIAIIVIIAFIVFYLQEKNEKLMFHEIISQQNNLNGWKKIMNKYISVSVFQVSQLSNKNQIEEQPLKYQFINQQCYKLFNKNEINDKEFCSILKNIYIPAKEVEDDQEEQELITHRQQQQQSIFDVIINKFSDSNSFSNNNQNIQTPLELKNYQKIVLPDIYQSYLNCIYHINDYETKFLDITLVNCNWKESETKVKNIIVTISDISLQVRNQRKEEIEQYKDKILSTITHELKTPLNGMICFLDASVGFTSVNQYKQINQLIRRNALLLYYMILQIIDQSQIQKGVIDLNIQYFDLKSTIEEVIDLVYYQIQEKKIELKFNYNLNYSKISSDQNRLKCLLLLFINNAIKYTNEGYISIEIKECLDININRQLLYIIIEDSGIGIENKQLKKLQKRDRNSTIIDQSKQHGAGIGLMFAENLLYLLGPLKKFQVESTLNIGTKFSFIIFTDIKKKISSYYVENIGSRSNNDSSQQQEQNSSYMIQSQEMKRQEIFVNQYKLKKDLNTIQLSQQELDILVMNDIFTQPTNILIVDDTIFNIIGLKLLLQYNKYIIVESATNGQEAIDKITIKQQQKQYSYIFMDINMPVMDGIEATKIIKKKQYNNEIDALNIIIVTAFTSEKDKSYYQSIGADYFIPKPVTLHDLTLALKNLVQKNENYGIQ